MVNFTMAGYFLKIFRQNCKYFLMFLSFGNGITIRVQNPQKKKRIVVPATALEKYGRF